MSRSPREQFVNFGDDLIPGFDLVIEGQSVGKTTQLFEAVRPLVTGVVFEEDEELSSMFTLSLANQPEISAGKPVNWRVVVDSKAFQEGNSVDLFLGYGNQRNYVDRVEIVKWLPDFPSDGQTTFTLKGFDGRHRLAKANVSKGQKKQKVFYKNLPDELIVKKIADKYGFGVNTDPTEVRKKGSTVISKGGKKKTTYVIPTRVQASSMSDWKFLQKLAQIHRFDLWVDYSRSKKKWIIHFKKREDIGQPEFSFTYNGADGSLISATPDFSIQDQPTDVNVLYYDRKKKSVQLTTISDHNKGESVKLGGRLGPGHLHAKKAIAQGARVRFTAFGQTIDAFSDKPFRSKKDAQNFVQHWLSEKERDFLILKGEVVGTPSLRPRQIHEFSGMSARLDGLYRLTSTTHKLEPGQVYTTEFVAHKVQSQHVGRKPKVTTKGSRSRVVTKENRVKTYGAPR